MLATFFGESTRTDALGARRLAEERGWHRIVVVTDDWHSRRAQLVFNQVFGGSPVAYAFSPAHGPRFDAGAWWLDETSALLVVSEYLKIVAYLSGIGA